MRFRAIATIAGGITIAAGTIWMLGLKQAPQAHWTFDGQVLTQQFADVAAGARCTLDVQVDRSFHAYVFSHNPTEGTACLFPSPWLKSDQHNPIAAGRHQLPGSTDDQAVTWPGPSALGATDLVVLLSNEPVAELDRVIQKVRQASNQVFPDSATAVLSLPRDTSVDALAPRGAWPAQMLVEAAAQVADEGQLLPLDGHPGIWCGAWKVVIRERAPVESQIRESFGPLMPQPQPVGPK